MKKIFLTILFTLFLSGCKASHNIYYNMYIASLGIEYVDGEYTGYFFLPNKVSTGSGNGSEVGSSEGKAAEVATVKGKTISEMFDSFNNSSALQINLKHISSAVLHESMLDADRIDDFIWFVKNSEYFDYNFYMFTTKDKIEDVYKLKNPNDESIILSILSEPVISEYLYTAAKPIHYLNFCRDYYNNKVLSMALIETDKIWQEETDAIYCRGIAYISKEKSILLGHDEEDFKFFKDNDELEVSDDNISVTLIDYDVDIKYKDKVLIKVKSKYEKLYSQLNDLNQYLNDYISDEMNRLIEKYNPQIDFLNLKYNKSIDKEIEVAIELKEVNK